MRDAVVFGVDHSLTALGLAAVPSDWGLDFSRVRRVTLTTGPELSQVERRAALARDVYEFVQRAIQRFEIPVTTAKVYMEGGIFSRKQANTVKSQERLAGVIEHVLFGTLGLHIAIAQQQSVRSLFMGKSARGPGVGDSAQALLRACADGLTGWDEAELDAFLVANYALSELGYAFVSVAPQTSPKGKGAAA